MKLSLMAVTALAMGAALVAADAQTSAPAVGERLTVTGCLQRAQRNGSVGGTVVGTSASPNTADDEANSSVMVNAFLLTDAQAGPANTGASAVTSGRAAADTTPTGTAGRADRTTFGLEGQEAQLEPHQGARLAVTGTVIPPARSGRGTGGDATATGVKRLKVESYKVIAEKCTGE